MIFNFTLLHGQDKIISLTQSNDTIACKVVAFGDEYVHYKTPGDTAMKRISTFLVKKVLLANGDTRLMNSRIVITNEEDWEKVIVTNSYADIDGFEKEEELTSKYSLGTKWNIGTDERMKKKAIEDLKHAAAKKGIPIIYIASTNSYYGGTGTYGVVSGILYNYPKSLNIVETPNWNKLKGAMR